MATHVTHQIAAACFAMAVTQIACARQASEPAPAASASPAASQTAARPVAPAAGDPVWHYEGDAGPERWGSLSPQFASCGNGRSQSPIDIAGAAPGATPALKIQFPPAELRIVHLEHVADEINNGHTIQVNYEGADTLTLGDVSYQLAQYHFHDPSEHTVAGKRFPMEMHLVHKSADGRLAVVAVLIEEGQHNKAFDPVWANLPAQKGVETHLPAVKVDVDALIPTARTTYRYDGSLTTPPCSEGVKWMVMTTPIQLSTEHIAAFTRLIKDNSRPLQALDGRTVLTDVVSVTSAGR